jgi:hypothetical protein
MINCTFTFCTTHYSDDAVARTTLPHATINCTFPFFTSRNATVVMPKLTAYATSSPTVALSHA